MDEVDCLRLTPKPQCRAGLVVKNFSGVVLNLRSSQTGLELKLANEGLSITPAWD
ncbi:MAG: hypothetical protein ACYDIC_04740 [Desulfobaccales bacterium]